MNILEDLRYGRFKNHEYRLLTSQSIQNIWEKDSENEYSTLDDMYDDVSNLMQESINILSKYGYDFDSDYLDFRIDFDDLQLITRKTISYVFEKYADKDGADLVAFDTGYIGFVFYKTNIINSIEILGYSMEEYDEEV